MVHLEEKAIHAIAVGEGVLLATNSFACIDNLLVVI